MEKIDLKFQGRGSGLGDGCREISKKSTGNLLKITGWSGNGN